MATSIISETGVSSESKTSITAIAKSNPLRRSFVILFCSLAIYLVTWGGHYTTGDGAHKVAWAKVMLWGPSEAGMEPGPGGLYSKYGIGHSLIAMPPLVAAHFIRQHTGIHCEAAFYTLIFIVNGALLVALIAFYLFHFYDPRKVWITTGLIALASTWWPYIKMDVSEVLVATIFFAGFVLMRFGRPMLGMAVAASILTVRTDGVILLALLLAWWFYNQKSLSSTLKLALAALPAVAVVFASKFLRYGSLMDYGYSDERFSTPLFLGLYGILFSAGKSVFLFSPPLILGFLGWRPFRRQLATKTDALLFIAIFLAQLILYSRWWDWSSDDAWGIRFMIPGIVFMCIPAVEALHHKFLTVAVACVGVSVQVLAVAAGGLNYIMLIRSQNAQRQALYVAKIELTLRTFATTLVTARSWVIGLYSAI